jgi:hypothetical protein
MKKIYVLDTPARRPTRVARNVPDERLRRYVRVGGQLS